MRTLLTLGIVIALAGLVPAGTGQYGGPSENGTCDPDGHLVQYWPTDARSTSYPVYVTIDEVASNGYLFSTWLYAESNGVPGLQRYDGYCYDEGYGPSSSDTIFG